MIHALFKGIENKLIQATILQSSKVTDINTFDKPFTIIPKEYNGVKKDPQGLTAELPPASIVLITLQ